MEQEDREPVALLNQASHLFLREISEPEQNSLRLVVEQAIPDPTGTVLAAKSASSAVEISKGAFPIRSIEGCSLFELVWQRYAAYLVTEEILGSCGHYEDEVYTGNLFRVYTKSHFLEHLSRDTGPHLEPIVHYKLICENHLIDVASSRLPDVRLLKTGNVIH